MGIKLVATDVDGVLTDCGMYYTQSGDEFKKFNTRDGMGMQLLRKQGLKTAIITSENTFIVQKRAEKLKVDFLRQGVKDKLSVLKEILTTENLALEEVAYIGDDINDIEVLNAVGIKACPRDATNEVKEISNIIQLNLGGGKGVFREFCEMILKDKFLQ